MKDISNKSDLVYTKIVSLNSDEVYIVRLVLHGLTTNQIIDFLDISIDHYLNYINSIKTKLNCDTWFKSVIKCFDLGILKHEDFIDDLVKANALRYSEKLLDINIIQKQSLETITLTVVSFLEAANTALFKLNEEKFSIDEINYLKLKFGGMCNVKISKNFNFSNQQMIGFQEALFLKLAVNDWYNAFKKAFQLQIIQLDSKGITNQYKEAQNSAAYILAIFYSKSLSEKEKQLMCYNELLKAYALIEFSCLAQVL